MRIHAGNIKRLMSLAMAAVLCITGLAGCNKTEQGTEQTEADVTSEARAEWLTADIENIDKKCVKLAGDTLYWAEWNYNIDEKKTENNKVCLMKAGSSRKKIFAKEDISIKDFFLNSDGSRICYMYTEDEKLVMQTDKLKDGEAETISTCVVEDAAALDALLTNAISDGAIDDDGNLWVSNYDNQLIKIETPEEGSVVAAVNTQSAGNELLLLDGAAYVYNVENNVFTLYSCVDMSVAAEYDFVGEGLIKQEVITVNAGSAIRPEQVEVKVAGSQGNAIYVVYDNNVIIYSYDGDTINEIGRVSFEKAGINGNTIEQVGWNDNSYYLYAVESGLSGEDNFIALSNDGGETKIRIELACLSSKYDDTLRELISEYNKYSKDYYIEVRQYDFRTSYDDFYLDIIRGQGADCFLLNEMQIDMLAEKGVLEELSDYYAASGTVSLDMLEDSVAGACELNGGQYVVMSKFYIMGFFINKEFSSYLENGVLQTSAMYEIMKEHPAMTFSGHNLSGSNLFYNALLPEFARYIDWDNMTCHYDDGKFAEVIKEVDELQNNRQYDDLYNEYILNGNPFENIAEKMYNNVSLLGSFTGFSVKQYAEMKDTILDVCDITGYPGNFEEPYYIMRASHLFGMNHSSAYKDGVWDFFEFVYSDKVQRQEDSFGSLAAYYFSPLKQYNQEIYDAAMAGELGIQQSYSHQINQYSHLEMEGAPALDEQDIALIQSIVDDAHLIDNMYCYDLTDILYEELDMFFAGDRSAQETAKIIQGRVELYLGE